MAALDTTVAQALDFDLFVHDVSGNIFIAIVESELGQEQIRLYGYNPSASLVVNGAVVSDQPGDHRELALVGDVSDGMMVTWSGTVGGATRGYLQLMRTDGFALGSNQLLSASTTNRQEATPVAAMYGGYYYCAWADSRNAGAGFDIFLNSFQYTSTDADDNDGPILPTGYALDQNFPNPFNPETIISFSLDKPALVTLTIFNLLGQQVAILVDAPIASGRHEVRWDSRSSAGAPAASGIYFYRLTVDGAAITKKMALVK
jgi:hypothetical protein